MTTGSQLSKIISVIKAGLSKINSSLNGSFIIREVGYVTISQLAANEATTVNVTFTNTYSTAPYVILTGATAGGYFLMSTSNVSNTGFTLNTRNPMSYTLSGGIRYYTVLLSKC